MSSMQTSTFVSGFLAALVVQNHHSQNLEKNLDKRSLRVVDYLESLVSSQNTLGPGITFELINLAQTLDSRKFSNQGPRLGDCLKSSSFMRPKSASIDFILDPTSGEVVDCNYDSSCSGTHVICMKKDKAHALLDHLSDEWRQIVENSARVFSGQTALPLVKPRAGEGLTKGAALRWEM